jgi:flagellar protein FlgJ
MLPKPVELKALNYAPPLKPPAPTADEKKLRKASQEFEAVFIQQLLDAMEKTVNREDSILSGGHAEETFRGMLHQHISLSVANRPGGSGFGLAEQIYRQIANPGMSPDAR